MRGHFLRAAATGVNRRTAILSTATTATLAYIAAVEAADEQQLEDGVLAAMVTFANWRIPLGGACCLMTGPRTLAGALVPMVGPVPTGVNLVAGDYNRLWVQLNGSTKYIDFNYDSSNLSTSSCHYLASLGAAYSYLTAVRLVGGSNTLMGTGIRIDGSNNRLQMRLTSNTLHGMADLSGVLISGMCGASRTGPTTTGFLYNDVVTTADLTVVGGPSSHELTLGARFDGLFHTAIAPNFYSVGTDIDLVEANNMIKATTAAITAALP